MSGVQHERRDHQLWRRAVEEGTGRGLCRPARRHHHRRVLHRASVHPHRRAGADRLRSGRTGAGDLPRRVHPDAPGRLRIPRAQCGDARLGHLLHLGDARLRSVDRVDERMGADRGHRRRPVEPRGHRGRLLLPVARTGDSPARHCGSLRQRMGQHPHLPGLHHAGDLDRVSRHADHPEAPVLVGGVSADGVPRLRRGGDLPLLQRHRCQSDALEARMVQSLRRRLAGDLCGGRLPVPVHLLGLGRVADGQ